MQLHKNAGSFILVTVALALLGACEGQSTDTESQASAEPQLDSLVSVEWLDQHLDDSNLVILDCTVLVEADENGAMLVVSGRANYEAGHIPTAGFADLLGDLSDGDSPLQLAMPTLEKFTAAIGALGIDSNSTVILYSADNPDWAARIWWMLRWAGFDRVALLHGGLKTWVAEGKPLSTEPASHTARQFVAMPRPEMVATGDRVFAATDNNNVNLLDALPLAHYRGDFSMYARPGHILGATSLPSSDLLDAEGRYRPFDELEMTYDGDRDTPVITYCGGGVAASSVAFTMHRLGFKDVAVYMGSLQEWAVDPENPMALGTE